MKTFKVGDKVAWRLLDGNVMTGTILDLLPGNLTVRRVDGTVCYLMLSEALWFATGFYTNRSGK